MPWVRFDDQFPIHRKVDGLSDAAYRLHTSAIFWSARNLTDGFVSREDLDGVTARVRTPARFAAECVRRTVWHKTPCEGCPSEKCPADGTHEAGWVVHDYWEYQPSKAQVVKEKAAAAKRQARWREARRKPSDLQKDNAVSNGTRNALKTLPRPAPKGSGGGQNTAPGANGRASPAGAAVARKPPWCGQCDPNTRQLGDPPSRCLSCHPLAVKGTP